jgi:hypothetical protein
MISTISTIFLISEILSSGIKTANKSTPTNYGIGKTGNNGRMLRNEV